MKINIRMIKCYIKSNMTKCITKKINISLIKYHEDFAFANFCLAFYNCI